MARAAVNRFSKEGEREKAKEGKGIRALTIPSSGAPSSSSGACASSLSISSACGSSSSICGAVRPLRYTLLFKRLIIPPAWLMRRSRSYSLAKNRFYSPILRLIAPSPRIFPSPRCPQGSQRPARTSPGSPPCSRAGSPRKHPPARTS